jgi:hypothetical protein
MDYLTILATRYVILFPHPITTMHAPLPSTSSAPHTPTGTAHLVRPTPISIPIQSILLSDTDLAYFLVRHVLSSQPVSQLSFSRALSLSPPTDPLTLAQHDEHEHEEGQALATSNQNGMSPGAYFGNSPVGGYGKEITVEAEVMVWKEIDKAKNFVRALGSWVAGHGSMSEGELKALAEVYGLGVNIDGQEGVHLKSHIEESLDGVPEHSISHGSAHSAVGNGMLLA